MNQRAISDNFTDSLECVSWLDGLVGNPVDVDFPDGAVVSSIASFQIIKRHEDDYLVVAVVNTEQPK